jgi:HPr kinase/phosphorylase
MDCKTTISTLVQHNQQGLSLTWISGRDDEHQPLGSQDQTAGKSLVGHVNIIHPNQLQIIGHHELAYIEQLELDARAAFIEQLCAAQPAAIILCQQLPAPADLLQACQQTQTPLLGSGCRSIDVINTLRQYLDTELAEKTTLHGVFLEVDGLGVLLTGASGVGKSELALELVSRHHRLIADDAAEFSRVGPETLRGSCPEALRDFLEVRGLGILNIRAMYGDSAIKLSKDLHLIIHLKRLTPEDMQQLDRLQGSHDNSTILDIAIPTLTLPVATGRNLAVLVEAAVRDHILLRKGYNASEAFISRQRKLMHQSKAD